MHRIMARLAMPVAVVLAAFTMSAAELKPETLTAWSQSVREAEVGMRARLAGGRAFMWVDEDPARLQRVADGQIQVEPVNGRGSLNVPGGLIHDWIGAAFIPRTSLADVLSLLRDYDGYRSMYGPMVVASRSIERSERVDRFSMRWVHKALFVTAAMDTQYESRTFRVDDRRAYGIAHTTSIQEIANYGHAGEQLLPPDHGSGLIWRIYNIARYEERNGGVYVEVEALVLTRDIPATLKPMVKPLVAKLSRNALLVSLTQTLEAMHPREAQPATEITRKKAIGTVHSLAMVP